MAEHTTDQAAQDMAFRNGGVSLPMAVDILNRNDNEGFVELLTVALTNPVWGARLLYQPLILSRAMQLRQQNVPLYRGVLLDGLRTLHIYIPDFERALDEVERRQERPHLTPTSLTTVMHTDYPKPIFFVAKLLHEGLTLLAGKMKRGKSYLALDMAISISFGHLAFRRVPTQQAKVLYVSLEDSFPLIQDRVTRIHPTITTFPALDVVHDFPTLGNGCLDEIQHQVDEHGYGVVILDTLGRLTPDLSSQRKKVNEYEAMTALIGPLQRYANDAHIAIVMIDHVRKAEADDLFDTIMGTSAKMGVADHAIIYQRKDTDLEALLHMRGRWIGDDKLVLTMADGHLEFLGQGEQYDLSREQRRVLKALEDEGLPLKIEPLMRALNLPQGQYARFRQVLSRMVKATLIDRTGQGAYCALRRADYDDSEIPETEERERFP